MCATTLRSVARPSVPAKTGGIAVDHCPALIRSTALGDVDTGATGAGAHGPTGDALDNLTIDFGFVRIPVTQPVGLANTGTPAATQAGLAAALIVAGCLLLLAGRRRPPLPG